jgi:predicted metalloprotease with PDZ domain
MRLRSILLILLASAACLGAQEPIHYQIRFPAPHTHYLEIEARVPAGKPTIELLLPVWTPGSYLVREYSKDIEAFSAEAGGRSLPWEKTKKNRWRIESGGANRVTVRYKVYAHDSSVQGNWVDADFAMLNGAPNFMTLVEGGKRAHEVSVELPAAWKRSVSGMPLAPGKTHTYLAADYDELIDSPIYAGNAPVHEFEVDGKKHYLVNQGEGPMWDGPASAEALKKFVGHYARMMGGLPYSKYVFFNMIVESGGGLEHKTSTWMNASRWAWAGVQEPAAAEPAAGRRSPSRLRWLGLASHEYFHVWNVKLLRPVELGPFDYENEVYTKSLWISEGLTSYYGPLALRRAGLTTQEQCLRAMSDAIRQLQSTPGRLVQPVETSSFDTWIKHYRPDENTANTAISYYTKGEVLGFVLDAKIRKATQGKKSLNDVMRLAYGRYGKERGFTPDEFRQTASEVAGVDLGAWFRSALETTDEIDYNEALEWYGLRFRTADPNARPRVLTGLTTRSDAGRLVVTQVRRGTPGMSAGVNVDDEIVAVNGIRVGPERWPSRLEMYKTDDRVRLLIARRDEMRDIEMEIAYDASPGWRLEADPKASEVQKANLKAWQSE